MTSPFAGWTAHQIVGPLNKKEVDAALVEFKIERSSFRTWNTIEQMIMSRGDNVKGTLYKCGVAKANVEKQQELIGIKRRQEAKAMARNVHRHLSDFFFGDWCFLQ